MKARRSGFSDMFWYIVIGLLVLLVIVVVAIWVPDNTMPSRKWGDFVFFTLLLFVFLLKIYWKYRGRSKFWLALGACLLAHLGVYLPILWRIDSLPSLWYVLVSPFEAMAIAFLLWKLLRIPPNPKAEL